jgi:CRP/FNR family transcriptional regulator
LPSELEPLLQRATVERFRAGELLFREGEEPRGLLVVREGAGELARLHEGARQQRIGAFATGDVLAIASTLTRQRHLASARALVPTEVLRIAPAEVRRVCRRRPEVALSLHQRMEDRLNTMLRRLAWLADLQHDER